MDGHYAQRAEANLDLLSRLRARRALLPPKHRSALDGITHALKRDSMVPAIPARHLLYLNFDAAEPLAAIAVGNLDTAPNVTWQLSGMGIRARTAMWGAAREAGQLLLEQQRVGAAGAAVVAWLGYAAPGAVQTLTSAAARRGVQLLKSELLELRSARGSRPPFTAVEAHSYGATLAVRALEELAAASGTVPVDVLAVTGSAGVHRSAAGNPARLGLAPDQVFEGLARRDRLAFVGRVLSFRRGLGAVRFGVDGATADGLHAVSGHDTSRYLPDRPPRFGYRDPGTQSLRNLALITTGRGRSASS